MALDQVVSIMVVWVMLYLFDVPTAVPATHPTMKQPIALPRTAGVKISARMVCPDTMKYVPVSPVIILIAVNDRISGATAVPIEPRSKTTMAAL